MISTYASLPIPPRPAARPRSSAESEFLAMLECARLPVDKVVFSNRPTPQRHGEEMIATVLCPAGHALTYSLRELGKALENRLFNDPAVVPCLCRHCAYPGQDHARLRVATVHHRLALLRTLYPAARYLSGFDPAGRAREKFACGEKFADGRAHPSFSASYDKLSSARHGDHHCYVCAILAGQTPPTRAKSLDLLSGRMHMLADLVDQRCALLRLRRRPVRPSIELADRRSSNFSVSSTPLVFSCHQPEHASVVRTADRYFSSSRGGYCKDCLADAGLTSVDQLLALHRTPVVPQHRAPPVEPVFTDGQAPVLPCAQN